MNTASATLPQPPSLFRRIYGFGSIFAKAIRDSRRATIVAAALLAVTFLGVTGAVVKQFDTVESRAEMVALIRAIPPILAGMAGKVVDNVGTMGGYLQYKYGTFFPLVLTLWSILALSGTLASEAQRGSLDLLASTGLSRRRIAVEKMLGHLVPLGLTLLVTFASIAIAGAAYPVLPGDEISVTSAFAYTVWLGLIALAGGALAFALGPFVGRGAAAGIAGFVTFAGFILSGYQQAVPALEPFAKLTWWGWTYNHTALSGQYDWPPVIAVGALVIALLVFGVEAFARRDIGITSTIPTPSMPGFLLGLRRPEGRAAAISLGPAIWWGLGLGLFGLVMGGAARSFMEQLGNSPDFMQLLKTIFPNVDYASAGGFLQLLFVEFGILLGGLAAATFVAGWASDETSGRLEMVLATPLSRLRWALSGGIGMLINVAVFVALTMIGISLGVASSDSEIATPATGTLILGVYAVALIGIGMAVGGLFRTGWAAPFVVIFIVATWFLQLLGPLLGLPDLVTSLAMTSHFGQPMVGLWDVPGVLAALAIGVAGILVGSFGFARRDLRR
ncbi:MAG TPA: ABC transporter permease subunit [Candidatus Limnocylindrales bacterium]|nr:ABC transporter permease subunit [Candidatus Limnocylindrales bacterium]